MINHAGQPEFAAKQSRGRPTEFTEQVAREIIDLVRKGNFLETAAAFVGVTSRTIRNWMRWGKRPTEPVFAEFRRRVRQAQAEAEINDLEILKAQGGWQGAASRLERRNHRDWGRHRDKEHRPREKREREPQTIEEVEREIQEVLRGALPPD